MTKFYIANPERPIITVKATINGKGPFDFIFDTGASMTIIEKETADKLGLSEKSKAARNALGAGGALVARTLAIKSIKVDTIEAKDIQAGIIDLSSVADCGCIKELGGIIGYNFVKDYKVVIDYPEQEISFEKSSMSHG